VAPVRRPVQFPHRGEEGGRRRVEWPRRKLRHVRKLLVGSGRSRTEIEGPDLYGEIVFWGEWEALSRYETLNGFGVHRPVAPSRDQRPRGPQNTDPFVFGDRFLYTVCGQTRSQAKQLHSLGPGSVIVFGSVLKDRFVCDTVFVVLESVPHTRSTWPTALHGLVPHEFVLTTLEPMYSPRPRKGTQFTLHLGATRDRPIDGMFSFVPCRPRRKGRFERPAVDDLPGLPAGNKQAIRFNASIGAGEVVALWRRRARRVLERGLALGTYVELPRARARDY